MSTKCSTVGHMKHESAVCALARPVAGSKMPPTDGDPHRTVGAQIDGHHLVVDSHGTTPRNRSGSVVARLPAVSPTVGSAAWAACQLAFDQEECPSARASPGPPTTALWVQNVSAAVIGPVVQSRELVVGLPMQGRLRIVGRSAPCPPGRPGSGQVSAPAAGEAPMAGGIQYKPAGSVQQGKRDDTPDFG
jgi:hypothetical protein